MCNIIDVGVINLGTKFHFVAATKLDQHFIINMFLRELNLRVKSTFG